MQHLKLFSYFLEFDFFGTKKNQEQKLGGTYGFPKGYFIFNWSRISYIINSKKQYYKNAHFNEQLWLDTYLQSLSYKNTEVSKTAGIEKLPCCFLKNGKWVLSKLTSDWCNLFISLGSFPDSHKIAKICCFLKKWSLND